MRITRSLNLVLPVYAADAKVIDPDDPARKPLEGETPEQHAGRLIAIDEEKPAFYVHSAPISRTMFERYWKVIARTLRNLSTAGLMEVGALHGYLALRDSAQELGDWEGPDGVEQGLLPEIDRLCNVVTTVPGRGWVSMPLELARTQNVVDDEDYREVREAVVFFICNSAEAPRRGTKEILTFLFSRHGAVFSSQTCTEYAGSLRTSTSVESSGAPGQTVTGSVSGQETAADGTTKPLSVPA